MFDLNTLGSVSGLNSTCGNTTSTIGVVFNPFGEVQPQFIVFTFTKVISWTSDNRSGYVHLGR